MAIKKEDDDDDHDGLEFLQKRVNELVDRLEEMEEDIERITFVVALFSKYMQYYSTKNDYLVDKIVIQQAVLSTNLELQKTYGQDIITEYEEELIIAYLEKIQEKMFELSEEERKKLR